jgi:hypothetical protein
VARESRPKVIGTAQVLAERVRCRPNHSQKRALLHK